MDHADARNNRDAAQRSIWLHEENKRLAAENAELRNGYQANTDAATYAQNKMWEMGKQLAAANATLDRLREVVPEGVNSRPYDAEHLRGTIWHILYPPETTSIRDIAAARRFDAMPDDLAQRSVDGETNYVQLNTEDAQ